MSILDNFSVQEVKQLVSESVNMTELAKKLGYKSKCCFTIIRQYCEKNAISLSHFTGLSRDQHHYKDGEVFCVNSSASQQTLRRKYKEINPPKNCAICGQPNIWNGRSLNLVLDHINGQNHDNRLENLRWVCPNCDHQLETFCAKNIVRNTAPQHSG